MEVVTILVYTIDLYLKFRDLYKVQNKVKLEHSLIDKNERKQAKMFDIKVEIATSSGESVTLSNESK